MTARQDILKLLAIATEPVPVHAFHLANVSQTAISARLRELAREGLVIGQSVPGKNYKSWSLVKPTETMPLFSTGPITQILQSML